MLKSEIKKICLDEGADLFGVADIGSVSQDFLFSDSFKKKIKCAICLGVRVSEAILEEIEDQPTKIYFHHYRTVNMFLDQLALKIAIKIQRKGNLAIPVAASQIVDWQKQDAHLSHKKIGILAGLGWIGRNNLLVNEKLGSQFRLVTILTDLELKPDKVLEKDCGNCRLCVEVCPVGAIKDRPEEFDHMKCFDKLKEFQKQKVVSQYICGICVKACKGKDKIVA